MPDAVGEGEPLPVGLREALADGHTVADAQPLALIDAPAECERPGLALLEPLGDKEALLVAEELTVPLAEAPPVPLPLREPLWLPLAEAHPVGEGEGGAVALTGALLVARAEAQAEPDVVANSEGEPLVLPVLLSLWDPDAQAVALPEAEGEGDTRGEEESPPDDEGEAVTEGEGVGPRLPEALPEMVG